MAPMLSYRNPAHGFSFQRNEEARRRRLAAAAAAVMERDAEILRLKAERVATETGRPPAAAFKSKEC
jgi:hypothetical protein